MYPQTVDHLAAYAQNQPVRALYIVLLCSICQASNPFKKIALCREHKPRAHWRALCLPACLGLTKLVRSELAQALCHAMRRQAARSAFDGFESTYRMQNAEKAVIL